MVFPLRHAGTYGGPGPPHSGPARAPVPVKDAPSAECVTVKTARSLTCGSFSTDFPSNWRARPPWLDPAALEPL